MQAISANLLGLEWEGAHTALLRAGAAVAILANGVVAYAVSTGPATEHR